MKCTDPRRAGQAVLLALALAVPVFAAEQGGSEAAARALIREGERSLKAGDIERALRQFERALRLSPEDCDTYTHLARAHGAAHRFEEAHRVLANAMIHARGNRRLRYQIELVRGDLYRDEGQREQARKAYEQAVGLRFFNREARRRLQVLDEPEEPPLPE
ncbi:MAG: tetratricopeptide repeat protein [Acidobacteria bacterium]|nr:tetratricopeptide repeat protein [Acidobacteriota bacterium]